jgi:hypothetical protein
VSSGRTVTVVPSRRSASADGGCCRVVDMVSTPSLRL